MSLQRRVFLVTTAATFVGFAFGGAIAHACTSLATINISPQSGTVGDTLNGSGSGFNPATQVTVRLDTASGPILWAGAADRAGSFAFSFGVPRVNAGWHVIKAMTAAGTAQNVFEVQAPPQPAPVPSFVGPAPDPQQAGVPQPASAPAPQPESRGGTVNLPLPAAAPEAIGTAPAPGSVVSEAPQAQKLQQPGDPESLRDRASTRDIGPMLPTESGRSSALPVRAGPTGWGALLFIALGFAGLGILLSVGTGAFLLRSRGGAKRDVVKR